MPKKTETKPCTYCGEPMNAWPANRKLCGACQAYRDINRSPNLKKTCESCGDTFWPIRNNWSRCYVCSTFHAISEEKWPLACSLCGLHKRTAPGSTACVDCIQSDPKYKKAYLIKLSKRHKEITNRKAEEVKAA